MIRNELSASKTAIELNDFTYSDAMEAQVYQTSPDSNMKRLENVLVYHNGLEVDTAENSITTVVLNEVTLKLK
ncbi:hypothetical protein [Paenibacillus kribbensis]|uniref:hypothetical protein n=1 Tax=Paenibacillus kribbensis TaxID=172713 RepID=UPI001FCA0CA8|nr:hypothetical protein [Paenibacillus kribbensis]